MTLRSWVRMPGVAVFTLGLSQAALAASALDQVKQSGVIKVCLAQQQPDNYKDPALVNGPVSWSICSMSSPNG